MPKIIVQADQPKMQMTLSERIAPARFLDHHSAAQLIERLTWAAADAQGNFTLARSFEENPAFHPELNQRAAANGCEPGEVLIMPGLTVRVADTDEEAMRPHEQIHPAKDFAKTLAELGRAFGRLDFSRYDLDAPFPAEAVKYGQNSVRTQAEKIARVAREENLSLRETVLYFERSILNRSPAPLRPSPKRARSCSCRGHVGEPPIGRRGPAHPSLVQKSLHKNC